ncbi:MAG: ribosome recycling factor [Ignavibacteria bacterium RIFOXYB2_FULL_35_12]|nr:MAG: ribosome recycling factor [Ignavibacteria bacterium GWA2_36_19]OGU50763.1 MAG: ribosome recycling factor [Ignavibacteria bacterium GWC2_35_8]OGU55991.1 MAG: ribosome recycling factor [Ignavibacteria bacterium GWF2_35_20]OGU86234.1 MAG: ribosome recycling factor [Ignavibacteria bacterium RIFOXYA12_FULL_35_25]OGU92672.1 MAG: ribosome recycling factor [Ignavibacteria bacterium RIFOXYC12_FULL_35_11]OGU95618.1 MAG: ribosome recycling factor [Ignavibacteria bacterium RIFOXYB12_FULL_35_14]OG
MEKVMKDAKARMDKSLESLRSELAKIRSGKATTALLDGIKVDYYGTITPINQVGNLTVLDAHTLSFTPWDKSMVIPVDKAILEANIGFNPISDGTNLKIPIPPLNEERRKELVKLVKKFGEETRVAVRNIRRDANEHLKKENKDKKISEDELKDAEDKVQKLTDEHIKLVDDVIKHKEKEIMEV